MDCVAAHCSIRVYRERKEMEQKLVNGGAPLNKEAA